MTYDQAIEAAANELRESLGLAPDRIAIVLDAFRRHLDPVFAAEHPAVSGVAEKLSEGWAKYVWAFGEAPHGTLNQMAALVELSRLITAKEPA